MGITKQKRRRTKEERIKELQKEVVFQAKAAAVQAEAANKVKDNLISAITANKAIILTLLKRNGGKIIISKDDYVKNFVEISEDQEAYGIHVSRGGKNYVIKLRPKVEDGVKEGEENAGKDDENESENGETC